MELLELVNQMVSLNRQDWVYVSLPLGTTKIIIPLSMIGGAVLLVQTRKRRTSELLTSKHKLQIISSLYDYMLLQKRLSSAAFFNVAFSLFSSCFDGVVQLFHLQVPWSLVISVVISLNLCDLYFIVDSVPILCYIPGQLFVMNLIQLALPQIQR